ncbi:MAG: redoxin family protein [Ornithinimicrobium sp.]
MSIRHGLIAALAAGALTMSACGQSENDAAAELEAASDETSAERTSAQETDEAQGQDDDLADGDDNDSEGDRDGEEEQGQAEPVAGGADLSFSATTLEGEAFDGEQLAGKPSVLWFWAPWCPTCRAQAPAVSELATEYDGEVNVVGVGGAAVASEIEGVAEDIDGPTHLIDEPGEVWQHFEITAQSTYVIVDADGEVVIDGEFLSDDELRQTVADITG